MNNIFFENWTQLWHVGLMTIISFLTLFVFIRLSGKRTLAQFNAFDFIVTVALGSTLTYMMLAKVPLVEGILVLLLIIGMQYLFAKLSKISETMENVINASTQLLFYKGQYLKDSMKNNWSPGRRFWERYVRTALRKLTMSLLLSLSPMET